MSSHSGETFWSNPIGRGRLGVPALAGQAAMRKYKEGQKDTDKRMAESYEVTKQLTKRQAQLKKQLSYVNQALQGEAMYRLQLKERKGQD